MTINFEQKPLTIEDAKAFVETITTLDEQDKAAFIKQVEIKLSEGYEILSFDKVTDINTAWLEGGEVVVGCPSYPSFEAKKFCKDVKVTVWRHNLIDEESHINAW